MRHRAPKSVNLTDDVMDEMWASNREGIRNGTMGRARLYGKHEPTTITLLLTDADSPQEWHETRRRIREERLVLLGETHLVPENTAYQNNGHQVFFASPPIGYIYLIRHRLGHYNQIYATTYDGTSATQVPIHITK